MELAQNDMFQLIIRMNSPSAVVSLKHCTQHILSLGTIIIYVVNLLH